MIGIVDYGLGNVRAILNIYRRLGIHAVFVRHADDILRADRLILPGVGAFDWALERLNRAGICKVLEECVLGARRPVLGICVGMQMMARCSEEGSGSGLGWVDADVRRFPELPGLRLPHMGWNDVTPAVSGGLFKGLEHGARFYFLHSYFIRPKAHRDTLSTTEFGTSFASSVRVGNVWGVQFHPEKSHECGIELLRNFAHLS